MAAGNTRLRVSIDAVAFDNDKGKLNEQEKHLLSYSGVVLYVEKDHGIISARWNGKEKYAYFIFSNVYNTINDVLPINPDKIKVGMLLNFHRINIDIPLIGDKKCFHAGLVWKVRKPKLSLVTIDPASALSLLKSFLLKVPQKEEPLPKILPVVIPPQPKEKKLAAHNNDLLKGSSGFLWRAINSNEGMMLQKREKGSRVIWFNKSNLEKVKTKFNSVKQLYGIPLHFDAELLYAPSNQLDYIWYQGIAFWESGTPRPANGLVGTKIFDYKPTSEFSLLLKQGLELKQTGQFQPSKLDNVFRELTKTQIFTEAPQKAQTKPSKVDKVKQENSRRSSLPDSNAQQISSLNWRASMSSSSLPNDFAKKESGSSFGRKKEPSPILVGPVLLQPKTTETQKTDSIKITSSTPPGLPTRNLVKNVSGFGDHSCFQGSLDHFLNIRETKSMPDYFSRALDFKAIFSINNFGIDEDTIASRLPQEIEHWITTSHKENGGQLLQERKKQFASNLPLDLLESKTLFPFEKISTKYILKLNGSTVHVSQELKLGLIYCKYGYVIFDFDNFYDFDKAGNEWRSEKKIVNGLDVFFDAVPEEGNNYKYTATCVWVEKRPDIQALISSVAKVPEKLKRGKYFGHVVKLDLPSNAIVKLVDEDVGIVVTRSIFDPNKTNNIAEYLTIGQEVAVVMDKCDDLFYAQNAFRYDRPQFELNPDKNVKGCGVITNYSHHAGIFQFRTGNKIHSGIFSKDLARYFDDNGIAQYFPIGSCICFKGYDMRLALCQLSVIANEIRGSRVLKENLEIFGKEIDPVEFISKKIYTGTVKEIRRPYAFILESLDEKKGKVQVFVSSRKYKPSKGEKNLTYYDQIQHYVKINDSVMFTPEICSTTDFENDIHPFKWHAAQAWKVKSEVFSRATRQSSSEKENEESAMGDSFMTACSDSQDDNISDSGITEAISNLRLNRDFPAKEKEIVLRNILRDVIRNERFLTETVTNRIVENFFNSLKSNSSLKDLFKLEGKSVSGNQAGPSKVKTQNQGTQTVSTGKVLYFKISPS